LHCPARIPERARDRDIDRERDGDREIIEKRRSWAPPLTLDADLAHKKTPPLRTLQ